MPYSSSTAGVSLIYFQWSRTQNKLYDYRICIFCVIKIIKSENVCKIRNFWASKIVHTKNDCQTTPQKSWSPKKIHPTVLIAVSFSGLFSALWRICSSRKHYLSVDFKLDSGHWTTPLRVWRLYWPISLGVCPINRQLHLMLNQTESDCQIIWNYNMLHFELVNVLFLWLDFRAATRKSSCSAVV